MKIKLKPEIIAILEKLPETGMGYQKVDIILKDGSILKDRIVLNSTYLEIGENEFLDGDDIVSIDNKR